MLADDTKQKPPPELITAGAHSHCVRMDGSRLGGIEPRCRAKDPLEDQIPLKRFSQGQPLGSERGTVASPAPLLFTASAVLGGSPAAGGCVSYAIGVGASLVALLQQPINCGFDHLLLGLWQRPHQRRKLCTDFQPT